MTTPRPAEAATSMEHAMTHDPVNAAARTAEQQMPAMLTTQEQLGWLLDNFVHGVSGVDHALLVSRDGLKLLVTGMDKDWADPMAATICGLASLAHAAIGPTGETLPAEQIIIERPDCVLFITNSGSGQHGHFTTDYSFTQGRIDTVLGVIAQPDADVGTIGFEMSQLVSAFATHLNTPVRQEPHTVPTSDLHAHTP